MDGLGQSRGTFWHVSAPVVGSGFVIGKPLTFLHPLQVPAARPPCAKVSFVVPPSPAAIGRWCGRPRYVARCVPALLVLIYVSLSWRVRSDSFRVAAWCARCAVFTTFIPIVVATVDNVSAVPVDLDASRCLEGEDGDQGEGEGRRKDKNDVTTHAIVRVVVSLHHPCLRTEKTRTRGTASQRTQSVRCNVVPLSPPEGEWEGRARARTRGTGTGTWPCCRFTIFI